MHVLSHVERISLITTIEGVFIFHLNDVMRRSSLDQDLLINLDVNNFFNLYRDILLSLNLFGCLILLLFLDYLFKWFYLIWYLALSNFLNFVHL